jgi:two-component system, chemotaxis family, chemotaxis protein CheY
MRVVMVDDLRPRRDQVLMVEDSAPSRVQLKNSLEAGGFDVVEASDGLEALFRARQQGFDFVVTDIHMPGMNGLEFIRELRKISSYADKPVLVLTSDVSKERIAEIKKAGGTAWLEKPPNLAGFARLVRSIIDNARTRRSVPI